MVEWIRLVSDEHFRCVACGAMRTADPQHAADCAEVAEDAPDRLIDCSSPTDGEMYRRLADTASYLPYAASSISYTAGGFHNWINHGGMPFVPSSAQAINAHGMGVPAYPAVSIQLNGPVLHQATLDSLSPEERMLAHSAHARLNGGSLTFAYVMEAVEQAFGRGGLKNFEMRVTNRVSEGLRIRWTVDVYGWMPGMVANNAHGAFATMGRHPIPGTSYALAVTNAHSDVHSSQQVETKIEGEVVNA